MSGLSAAKYQTAHPLSNKLISKSKLLILSSQRCSPQLHPKRKTPLLTFLFDAQQVVQAQNEW